MTQFPNLERLYLQWIAQGINSGQPWYISNAVNSNMLPRAQFGDAATTVAQLQQRLATTAAALRSQQPVNTQGAFKTSTANLQPSGRFEQVLGNISGLLGVLATTYSTVEAAKTANKSPQEAAQILRAQGISVPPGQENALYYAQQQDAAGTVGGIPKSWLLYGGLGLLAVMVLRKR
jgi:hypothetical protein